LSFLSNVSSNIEHSSQKSEYYCICVIRREKSATIKVSNIFLVKDAIFWCRTQKSTTVKHKCKGLILGSSSCKKVQGLECIQISALKTLLWQDQHLVTDSFLSKGESMHFIPLRKSQGVYNHKHISSKQNFQHQV
jgi:hypothetical protein